MMRKIFSIAAETALAGALLCSCGASRHAVDGKGQPEGGNGSFPFALFNTLMDESGEKENILVSPYSAGVALGMLEEGAEGETAAQIRSVLGNSDWTAVLPSAENVELASANSVWVSQFFKIGRAYSRKLEKNGAQVTSLDFSDPESPARVNRWCAGHTEGKISQIVDKFSPSDVLLLANALHFKGAWETPFSSVSPDVFYGKAGKEKVPFMHRDKYCLYAEADGARMVELSFGQGDYAMYVVDCGEEGRLTEKVFNNLHGKMESRKVRLEMPEFKLETSMSLNAALQEMGVRKAFGKDAELGGIGEGPLVVSDVAQKTYIDVNKDGCEAAAVTSITVGLTAFRPVESIEMKLDRPFYYVISDAGGRNILFLGKLNRVNL